MRAAALAVCAVLLLAGCASTGGRLQPPQPSETELAARWQVHAARLAQVQSFSLRGRAADGRGVQAEVHWQQAADGSFSLRLAGPFGVGAVLIRGDSLGAVEIQTRDERIQTPDPEAWMRARIGWTFPVRGLRHWILGRPMPEQLARTQLDDDGRLAVLTQGGWQLNYTEYVDSEGLMLPRRLDATQDERRLRIVVDRWEQWSGA